jgi:hypothetical protein
VRSYLKWVGADGVALGPAPLSAESPSLIGLGVLATMHRSLERGLYGSPTRSRLRDHRTQQIE